MNIRKFLLLVTALVGFTGSVFADTQTTQATVSRLTGSATVTLPDGSTSALVAGAKVPQGATITTAASSEVYLETHSGNVATITANSSVSVDELSVTTSGGKVTEQKTMLNLKSGNVVSILDPNKKSVNNYAVRTPKGVAAARGTVFSVSYQGANYTIAVLNGVVAITPDAGSLGGISFNVGAGQVTGTAGGMTLGTMIPISEMTPETAATVTQIMAVAVATVAVAVENNIGGTTAAELQAVTQTVIAAVPEAAATITALVAVSAPTQSAAVQQTIQQTAPAAPPAAPSAPTAPTQESPNVTTPQPIDPGTVSRSGE